MTEVKKVPLKSGAEEKSYYHFYERDMAPVPEEKLELLKNPFGQLGEGMEIEDRNRMFEPGYFEKEIGIFELKEGGFVAENLTEMKGAKGYMLQWYFGWHALDPMRYAIWDPYDHYGLEISEEDRTYILDTKTPIAKKCQNVRHTVHESLLPGTDPAIIHINFKKPADMGITDEFMSTEQCSFMVCANVEIETPEGTPNLPVVMFHMARDTEEGCELRSRFWLGYQIIDGVGKCLIPKEVAEAIQPLTVQLLTHNFNEFTNMAAILPELYQEEKNNW